MIYFYMGPFQVCLNLYIGVEGDINRNFARMNAIEVATFKTI